MVIELLPIKEKKMNTITESESIIMELLWENGQMSVMQIVQALEQSRGWSKHTIISFLKRMEAKGTVTYHMRGRTRLYSATVEKDKVIVDETKNFANKFFGGKFGVMASYFLNNAELSDEEVDELWKLINNMKEKRNE